MIKNSSCQPIEPAKQGSSEESFSSAEADGPLSKINFGNRSQFAKASAFRRSSKKEERSTTFRPVLNDKDLKELDKISAMTPLHRAKTYFPKKDKSPMRGRNSNDSIQNSQKHSISRRRQVSVVSTQSLKQYKTKNKKKMIN